MKYLVEIDDVTETGKNILGVLKTLSKQYKSVHFLTQKELEDKEDALLISLIQEGMKSGKADKQKVLKKLNLQ